MPHLIQPIWKGKIYFSHGISKNTKLKLFNLLWDVNPKGSLLFLIESFLSSRWSHSASFLLFHFLPESKGSCTVETTKAQKTESKKNWSVRESQKIWRGRMSFWIKKNNIRIDMWSIPTQAIRVLLLVLIRKKEFFCELSIFGVDNLP